MLQVNAFERYIHGTPDWWKGFNAYLLGHGADAAALSSDPRE
jgi:hypothetical protein